MIDRLVVGVALHLQSESMDLDDGIKGSLMMFVGESVSKKVRQSTTLAKPFDVATLEASCVVQNLHFGQKTWRSSEGFAEFVDVSSLIS